jgi:hypothetical protein
MEPTNEGTTRTPEPQLAPVGDGWTPAAQLGPARAGSRRLRWGIAGAVMLCVVLVSTGAVYVLSGASGSKSLTANVAPKNSVAFLEIRTDLPGDQHGKLADFMSHFPGFKDRSQFDTALDEVLNRLTRSVSPSLSYTSAFKPWMEGEVSIAVTSLGSSVTATPSMSASTEPGVVVIVALKDGTAADKWVSSELATEHISTTESDYDGTTLWSFGTDGNAGAYAFTDQDLLMGSPDGVKAAIDSKSKGSLADNPSYKAAMASLAGDSLARFYLDTKAIVTAELDGSEQALQIFNSTDSAGLVASAAATLPISTDGIPDWTVGSLRADGDRLTLDVLAPGTGTDASSGGNHASRLAGSLPASTVLVTETHDLGKNLTTELATLDKQMSTDSTWQQVESALSSIGGLDWIGDASVVLTKNGSAFDGGVVIETTDADTANAKVGLLRVGLSLGGGSLGVTTRTESYNGTDITIVHADSNPVSNVGSMDLAIATKGNLIVAGADDSFVKSVVDTNAFNSLATQADYKSVMALVGTSNSGAFYWNVPALEDQMGEALFGVSAAQWTSDYKPYFDHLGGVGSAVVNGNTVILRLIVTAK